VPEVALPPEWLVRRLDELSELEFDGSHRWSLLPHCTERTNAPAATSQWLQLARRFGIELQIVQSGCCGMAGLYGHERANRKTSEAIYDMSWRSILSDPHSAGRTLATGYSCRCQAALMDGLQLAHPIQLLLLLLLRCVKADRNSQAWRAPNLAEHHEEP
jgi:Fe-S oxidoreductase